VSKKILVAGAAGFIGVHLIRRLRTEGYWVRGVDLKAPDFSEPAADEFIPGDLRDPGFAKDASSRIEEVYQLAADMGGAGYLFTGEHDAAVMHNSATINLNMLECGIRAGVKRFFYQLDASSPTCSEASAYPAAPDSEYGWEKLFSERLYLAYMRNRGVPVRVARFHNVFGPEGTWDGGREKSPRRSVGRWRRRRRVGKSKFGEMGSKPDRFSMPMSVWKGFVVRWTRTFPGLPISDRKRW
jgi:nucleoside-diphosphate-sugar epimerase